MSDLTHLSVETLQAMKARLTNWIVYVAFIDVIAIAAFVLLLLNSSPAKVLPFTPLIMIPSIALVPILLRTSAIKREMTRRAHSG